MTAARLQRYALFLAGFDYKIEYKSTTEHCKADGLSRLPLQSVKRWEWIHQRRSTHPGLCHYL